MSGFIKNNLKSGEVIRYQSHISMWNLLPGIILGIAMTIMGLFFIPLGAMGAVTLCHLAIMYYTTEIAITNSRVIFKSGFIRRSVLEISIKRIESIQVHQSVLGRLFNFGTVVASGAGNPLANISGIDDPMTFRNICTEIRDN